MKQLLEILGVLAFYGGFVALYIWWLRKSIIKCGYVRKRNFQGLAVQKIRRRMVRYDLFVLSLLLILFGFCLYGTFDVLTLSRGKRDEMDYVSSSIIWLIYFTKSGTFLPTMYFFQIRLTSGKRVFLAVWFLMPLMLGYYLLDLTGEDVFLNKIGMIASMWLALLYAPVVIHKKALSKVIGNFIERVVMLGLDREKYRVYGGADE